ncbi:BTAD domain-containing putative transcriptional regulator [Plantactinospora siamensis]|uniref:BTAD domain-containing putative transcriptional regulator n=1 Tax=Plantactinospora siamensis TaxID=555372 RepID=A0ABV6NUB3_9ACTN
MRLEIRLLGGFQSVVDGRVVVPGGGKRRAMLAGLALTANRSVSLDRLAGMVWAGLPPASALPNLRSYAAGLRRLLADRLVARPRAYELRLDPRELDVTEFARLAAQGRDRLADADPSGAIAPLTAALGLWRGAAGEGVPRGTRLDDQWIGLEAQRVLVFEELAEARLAVGRHADLITELRSHLTAHPLRERAWKHLMLALYRSGDVPAALTAYRAARTALDEQLGIEPGEELAGLHRAILDRSPAISSDPLAELIVVTSPADPLPATAPNRPSVEPPPDGWLASSTGQPYASGPAGTVPRELPADPVTFVGRSREVAAAATALSGTASAVLVVTGPPGGGKTALAVRAAHAAAAAFPDGQLFVDLGGDPQTGSDEVLARVLRGLGVAPADVPETTDERAGRFRSLTADRRILLVVDGVTGTAQIRHLIPAGAGPALVVVGQRFLGGLDGVRRVDLGPLAAPRRGRCWPRTPEPVRSRPILPAPTS